MIKAVLFDFGGVLTESGKKGFVDSTIAELYDQMPGTFDIGEWHYKLRRGKGDDDAFFADLNQRFGKHVTKALFLDKTQTSFIPSQEVYDLAKQLREAGIKTGILSNIFRMNARALQEQGWYDGFEPLILSCDEGYAKPDPEIYEIAIQKTGVAAEEILFVDDQDKCMPPAQDRGFYTLM
ncbi:MAG: HAD-IA family hydrolase, partial [Candidatus Saccharimonadales bacterium]